jgi:hypothetical protein
MYACTGYIQFTRDPKVVALLGLRTRMDGDGGRLTFLRAVFGIFLLFYNLFAFSGLTSSTEYNVLTCTRPSTHI